MTRTSLLPAVRLLDFVCDLNCHSRRGLRLLVCTLVAATVSASCVDRARLNDRCEFSETPRALDLSDRVQGRHLDEDVRLAEELGIRYGDSFRAREGLLVEGERSEECTSALFAEIARIHQVAVSDVLAARGRRDWHVDAVAVFLPMVLVMILMADVVSRQAYRRFVADERWALAIATIPLSLITLLFWMFVGDFWSWGVDSLRLREQHMSYRSFYRPWIRHPIAIAVGGLLLFWLVALIRYGKWFSTATSIDGYGAIRTKRRHG